MSTLDGRMSANRWNRLVDELIRRGLDMRSVVLEQLLVAGYPPGARPLTPEEEYQRLAEMRDAQDPQFWGSERAKKRLMDLELRFATPLTPAQPIAPTPIRSPFEEVV